MENKTRELLLRLESVENKTTGFQMVNEYHSLFKHKLEEKGIKFYSEDSQFSESIIGYQTVRGTENVELMKSYQEINYIKDIFKDNIYTMADEQKRYNPIREKIIEIISNYKKE
jgi:hypothetical protein